MTQLILDRVESAPLISLQDKAGETALHLAFYRMNLDIVELLLEKNAQLSIRNKAGKRPIDLISPKDPEKALQFLESIASRGGKLSAGNAEIIHDKIFDIQHELESVKLKDKWAEGAKKVFINDKNIREMKRRNYTHLGREKAQLLTVEDRLEYSLENALQYEEEGAVDFDNLSNGENENEIDFEKLTDLLTGIEDPAQIEQVE
jgi:hypothetical protein